MKNTLISLIMMAIATTAWAWQPNKDIELIVGFPPGGSTDVIARAMSDGFNRQGVKTVVINRPGAGSAIAVKQVMNSPTDGRTVMLTGTAFLFNHLLKTPGADYDPLTALSHLKLIGTVENHIYANSNTVSGDIHQIISDLRNQNKNYSVGITNPGAEFTAKLIESRLGIPINVIRYQGSARASTDLLGGHIDLVIDSGTGMLSRQPNESQVRFVATLNSKHTDHRPTVDAVMPGVTTSSWFGMSLPPNTPIEIIKFYNDLISKTLADPVTVASLKRLGLEISGQTDLVNAISDDLLTFGAVAGRDSNSR